MREWSRDERYRVLQSADEIRDLHEKISKSVYRQLYHVQPVTRMASFLSVVPLGSGPRP